MATRKPREVNLVVRSKNEQEAQIIEMQVFINSRGRSVMNGTVLYAGEMRTIKVPLDHDAISALGRLIIGVILHRELTD